MRFPWLQVDSDFLEATAGDLAALIGVSRREAIGLMVDLWAWGLTRSPKDSPPDGIISGTGAVPMLNRVASWMGPEQGLADALEQLGLLERLEDGIRLRGLDRYRSTWEKNRRRKPNRNGTGAEPERNGSGSGGEPARKMNTETYIEAKDSAAPAGDGEAFSLEPTPAADDRRRRAEERQREEAALEHRRKIRALLAEGYKRHTGREYQSTKPAADNVAVEKLAGLAPPEEIARRWGNLLAWSAGGFPAVASFGALTQHWNAIQVTDGVKKSSHAPVRANTTDWGDPSVEDQRI